MNDYLKLSAAAKLCPGRPHAATLWRWCRKGVKTRVGDTIKLRHARVGGILYVTSAWLMTFFEVVAEADAAHFDKPADTPRPKSKRPSDAQRQAQIDAANKTLREAGILA